MEEANTSYELLAHFDRPRPEEDFALSEVEPPILAIAPANRRGVFWVLAWAAALSVLVFSAARLLDYAYVVAAQTAMNRAARAGALEATLPRASLQSVSDTIARRLANYPNLAGRLRLNVELNDVPVRGEIQLHDGDLVRVSLTADSDDALLKWLEPLRFWATYRNIEVRAERLIPGNKLVAAQH